MAGKLFGVGVGPGDPELLTIKGYRTLKESDVIAYPAKKMKKFGYAYAIISHYFEENEKEWLALDFPMTKDPLVLNEAWRIAANEVAEKIKEGKTVSFITEGDPLFYSTYIHLMNIVQQRFPEIEITCVPGISSINGVSSRLNLPLADGNEKIAIVPAEADVSKMKTVLETFDCIIFLKISKVIKEMLKLLKEMNLYEKAHVVTKVTSDEEIVWNLSELEDVKPEYLTLMVVRK